MTLGNTPAHSRLNQAATGADERPFAHVARLPACATPQTRCLTRRTCPVGEAEAPADNALLLNPDPVQLRAQGSVERPGTGEPSRVSRPASRTTAHAWDCF